MSEPAVLDEAKDPVAAITLNRPENRNRALLEKREPRFRGR